MFPSTGLELAVSVPGTDEEKGLWLKVINCQKNFRAQMSNIMCLQCDFR